MKIGLGESVISSYVIEKKRFAKSGSFRIKLWFEAIWKTFIEMKNRWIAHACVNCIDNIIMKVLTIIFWMFYRNCDSKISTDMHSPDAL